MASVARNSSIMFAGTLVSRVLGFIRSPLLLGAVIGINYPAANSFDIANRLPTLIYMIIAGGVVNAVLVPAIVRAAKRDADGGQSYINKLVTLGTVAIGGITVLLTLAAPLLVKLFAATLSPDWYGLTLAFAYWCIPQVFFYGMYTLLGQILNAKENFGPYMWAPAANNIVAIAGLLLMLAIFGGADPATAGNIDAWTGSKITLLAGTATLGIAVQCLVLIYPLYRIGVRLRPDFQWRGAGLSSAAKSGTWVLITMFVSMLPTVLISNVAAYASDQAVSGTDASLEIPGNAAYTASYAIYTLPTSLVVVSIVTAIFTRMATSAAAGKFAAVRFDTSRALRVVGVFTALATALIVVLAIPLVRLMAATVTMVEVRSIATVLMAMSLGLMGVGAFTVLQRVYYALEDARGLFFVQLPWIAVNAALILSVATLPPRWIVVGVGGCMAITNTLTALAAARQLRGRLGGIDGKRVLATYARLVGVGIITTIVGAVIFRLFGPFTADMTLLGAVLRILIIGPVMVAVFLGLMALLQMRELPLLVGPVRALGRKLRIIKAEPAQPRTISREKPTNGVTVSNLEPGRRLRDRYELVSRMSGNALASDYDVWQGEDTVLGIDVRIIIIPASDENHQDILDSARRSYLVKDTHLVSQLSVVEGDDFSLLVTEIPPGISLDRFIANGALPVDQARAITAETAKALNAGVQRGVRHLLLRPALVSISEDGFVFVDGLGIDAAMAGVHPDDYLGADLDRQDARTLSLLFATMLAGRDIPETREKQNELLAELAGREDLPEDIRALLADEAEGRGPVSTGDVIRAIAPWDRVDYSQLPEPAAPAEPVYDDGAAVTSFEENAEESTQAMPAVSASSAPEGGARHASTAGLAAAGAAAGIVGSGATAAGGASPDPVPSTPPPPAPPESTAPATAPATHAAASREWSQTPQWEALGATGDADYNDGDDDYYYDDDDRGFNFIPWILGLIALAVLAAGWWAVKTLTADTTPVSTETSTAADGETTVDPTADPTGENPTEEPTTEEPTTPDLPAPVISNVTLLNPNAADMDASNVAEQDSPWNVVRAFDGDPNSIWSTWTYVYQDFGRKQGLGLVIELEEEALVSEIELQVLGNGGNVQWRDTVAAAPDSGVVITEGPMSGSTVLTAPEPIATDTLIIWFTDTPVANDGGFRIDLQEIIVR